MNVSKKLLILGLLISNLQIHASSHEDNIKFAEKFHRDVEFADKIYAPYNFVAKCASKITDVALMPGQQVMTNCTQGLGFTANAHKRLQTEVLNDFKKVQYERCKMCTSATCLSLGGACMLYAAGYPVIAGSPVECLLSTACLSGTIGCVSTCCPCTKDKTE